MNKIAVTGANGMTGSHMMSFFKNKGISAKAVTRQEWDLTEWKSFNELDCIFGSVRVVFHFGAQLPYNDLKDEDFISLLSWCEDWDPEKVYKLAYKQSHIDYIQTWDEWADDMKPLPLVVRMELQRAIDIHDKAGNMAVLRAYAWMFEWFSRSAKQTVRGHDATTIKLKADKAAVPCGFHVVSPSIDELKKKLSDGYRFLAYSTDSVISNTYIERPIL